jgi:hypothetical protein
VFCTLQHKVRFLSIMTARMVAQLIGVQATCLFVEMSFITLSDSRSLGTEEGWSGHSSSIVPVKV